MEDEDDEVDGQYSINGTGEEIGVSLQPTALRTLQRTRAVLEHEARLRQQAAEEARVTSYDSSQDQLPLNSLLLAARLRSTLELQDRDRSVDELLVIRNFIVRSGCLAQRTRGFVMAQFLALGRAFILERYSGGDFVYRMAQTSERIYVVVQGECRVIGKLPADEGGGDYEVMACGPGALLGERALDHYGPRIDKVLAVSELYVMSVAAARFKEIAKTVEDNVIEEFSMREKVHNILSRPPSLRTRDDLGVVISHVGRKLNILQSLPYDGLIELFRTCDYIISVGKQKLFKQGDEGQAMYIILRGFVHAYDRIGDFTGRFIENAIKVLPAGAGFGGKALCESESGGVTASHLPKSCLRTLTYATEDAETALVVFDKDEFKKISKIIKHELFAEKIALLRRSYVFQSLDLEVLFELAQLMVPCSWKVDSVVHSEGDICDSITIIVLGEMFVNSKAAWNKAINTSMNFGRIGPAAVVGEYCVLCENPENEIRCIDSITTRTNCKGFRISKSDFFTRLPPSTLDLVRSVVGSLGKLYQGHLWGLTPGEIKPEDWTVQKSWQSYRNAVVGQTVTHSIKNPDITGRYRKLKDSAGMTAEITNLSTSATIEVDDDAANCRTQSPKKLQSQPKRISILSSPKRATSPPSRQSAVARRETGLNSRYANRRQSNMLRSMEKHSMLDTKFAMNKIVLLPSMNSIEKFRLGSKEERDGLSGIGKMKAHVSANVFRPPFALVQFHKEKFNMRPVEGSSRRFRTYLRLCALSSTCNDAKVAAEAQINYVNSLARHGGIVGVQSDTKFPFITSVAWTRFTGYSTIPLHHTDHFLIFCRGSPVEFTSFSPPVPIDLLEIPFPNSCKLPGQVFGCISLHRILAPRPGNSSHSFEKKDRLATPMNNGLNASYMSSGEDSPDPEDPLVMREISCVSETMGTSSSRMDSFRYASYLMESGDACNVIVEGILENACSIKRSRWSLLPDCDSVDPFHDTSMMSERLVVVPMYAWILVDEETFRSYDCAEFDPAAGDESEPISKALQSTPAMETVKSLSRLETAAELNAMAPLRSVSLSKLPAVPTEALNSINHLHKVVYDGSFVSDAYKAQDFEQRRHIEDYEVPGPVSKVLLKNEKFQRTLMSDVDKKATTLKNLNEYNLFSPSFTNDSFVYKSKSTPDAKHTVKPSDTTYSGEVERRMAAVTVSMAIRQRALELNDEICEEESKKRIRPVKDDTHILSELEIGENSIIAELLRRSHSTEAKSRAKEGPNATNEFSFVDLDSSQKLLMKKRAEMFETLQTFPKTKSSTALMEFSSRSGSRAKSSASSATWGCDRSETGGSLSGSCTSEGKSSVGRASKGAGSAVSSEVDSLLLSFKKPVKLKIDFAKILADKLEVLNMSNQ